MYDKDRHVNVLTSFASVLTEHKVKYVELGFPVRKSMQGMWNMVIVVSNDVSSHLSAATSGTTITSHLTNAAAGSRLRLSLTIDEARTDFASS